MAAWEELKENWKTIETAAEKREQFDLGEYGVVIDFETRIRQIVNELEELEKEIEKKGVSSPDPMFRDSFKSMLERLHSVAFNAIGGGVKTRLAKESLEAVWNQALLAITSFLERRAKAIGVESWSLAASVGFPMGVSGTVSVNFRF